MKIRVLLLLPFMLLLSACGNNEPSEVTVSGEVKFIWETLNGSYAATYYIAGTENVWYTETITFHPFSEPQTVLSVLDGDVVALGQAVIADTRFTDISGEETAYYSIEVTYAGAPPTVSFYRCNENGDIVNREDKRRIADVTTTSFRMWSYGLTEAENSHTYTKQ